MKKKTTLLSPISKRKYLWVIYFLLIAGLFFISYSSSEAYVNKSLYNQPNIEKISRVGEAVNKFSNLNSFNQEESSINDYCPSLRSTEPPSYSLWPYGCGGVCWNNPPFFYNFNECNSWIDCCLEARTAWCEVLATDPYTCIGQAQNQAHYFREEYCIPLGYYHNFF